MVAASTRSLPHGDAVNRNGVEIEKEGLRVSMWGQFQIVLRHRAEKAARKTGESLSQKLQKAWQKFISRRGTIKPRRGTLKPRRGTRISRRETNFFVLLH